MEAKSFTIARKPVPINSEVLAGRRAQAGAALVQVRTTMKHAYCEESVHGVSYNGPSIEQAMDTYGRAVRQVATAVAQMPRDPTLGTHLSGLGLRVALGARGVAKAALGVSGGVVLLSLHAVTLGATAWSTRFNLGVRYALLHGCLRGAATDMFRMASSESHGEIAKYAHLAVGAHYQAKLAGGFAPVFDGVREMA